MNFKELSTLNLFKIYQVEFESFIASHRATPVIVEDWSKRTL